MNEERRFDATSNAAFATYAHDSTLVSVARATPIYFIGDSSALIFRDRVYRRPGTRPRHYVARTVYCPGLRAADFALEDGSLNPLVVRALLSENVVVEDGAGTRTAAHVSEDQHWRVAATIEDRPRTSPILVLMCGSLDVLHHWREVGQAALSGADAQRGLDEFARLMRRSFAALGAGITTLRSWGLERVFVQSIMPPQIDGDAIADHFEVNLPLAVRTASTLLANRLLADVCRQTGAGFIDTWDATEQDGSVRTEFVHDTFHFNEHAAFISVQGVVAAIAAR